MSDDTFEDDMEKLAHSIAKDANRADVAFADKIDAFKGLMPYYALRKKTKPKDDDDEDIPSFTNFQRTLKAVE